MSSAHELKMTLRVMRALGVGQPELHAEISELIAKQEKIEAYARGLVWDIDPTRKPVASGLKLLAKLKEDGWTPPDGLLDG